MKKSPKIVITQEEVDEFAVIKARMDIDDKRRRKLREKFIDARIAGIDIPTAGPHLIKFTDKDRRNIPWKDEAFLLARILFGSLEAATEHINMIEAEADITPVVEVSTTPNPNWVAKPQVIPMPVARKARR